MADKVTVTNKVVNYIRSYIESSKCEVGDKIPSENQLCQELGVSRVSVRSAIQQFVALDILKSIHGKGTVVLTTDLSAFGRGVARTESIGSLKEVLKFRHMIEPEICACATQNATPELVQTLTDLLEQMRQNVNDTNAFVKYDMLFHEALCHATGNPVVETVMTDIFREKMTDHYLLNVAIGVYGGMYYHTLLLKAIKNRDDRHARSLMSDHLRTSIEELDLSSRSTDK